MEDGRVVVRGKVEEPEHVDHGEQERAGADGLQRAGRGVDANVGAQDGEDEGDGVPEGEREPVRLDRVGREGAEDARREGELEQDAEPADADGRAGIVKGELGEDGPDEGRPPRDKVDEECGLSMVSSKQTRQLDGTDDEEWVAESGRLVSEGEGVERVSLLTLACS